MILEDAEPRIVVCEVRRRNARADSRALRNPHVIPWANAVTAGSLLHDPAPEPPPSPQTATLQYTGGMTGIPKGVDARTRQSRSTLRSATRSCPRIATNGFCAMPLYHTYAVAMCLHNAANWRHACRAPAFQLDQVLETLQREQITVLAGAPSLFVALTNDPAFAPEAFSTLRSTYSGSAPLPEALLRRFEDATGAPVLEGYGQSESGPVLTFNPRHGLRKLQSVGIPVPQTELQIVDALNGERVLGTGEVGEIRVRGPQIMIGYRKRPAETADALRGHWLYTGDLGELDEDGYLFIRDRKKAMLLVSGFNVYPRELEEVLCQHAAVAEAAVIGVPDQRSGSRIKAYVVARAGAPFDASTLERHCRANLAPYKVPREFLILERMPRTSVGKIDKKLLG
jgi:long-chain acyl-CoA synthetase